MFTMRMVAFEPPWPECFQQLYLLLIWMLPLYHLYHFIPL